MKKSCLIQHRLLGLSLMMVLPFVVSKAAETYDTFTDDEGICYNYKVGTTLAEVTKLSSGKYSGEIVIPATTIDPSTGIEYEVDGIEIQAFYKCTNLTKVTIPSSVTSIGSQSFSGCTNLKSLVFEGSDNADPLTMQTNNSESHIFDSCPLEELYIDRDISYYEDFSPFRGFSSLTSVTLGEHVTTIGQYAFYLCTNLASLNLPYSLTSIGEYAFPYSKITEITIPNSVTSMGESIFCECESLTKATINGVIGQSLFRACSALEDVTISDSVTSIGMSAFYKCVSIKEIKIPESVTEMGSQAFYGCKALEKAEVYSSIIGNSAFYTCSTLKDLTLENTVSIDANAFRDCSALTEVTLPKTLTTVGSLAFDGCTLKTMYIFPRLEDYSNLLKFSCPTIYVHKDQLDIIKEIKSNYAHNYYALEDVYTLTVENEYLASIKLKVLADEKLLIDGVSIKSLTLKEKNSDTSIAATLESEDGLEYIYVAKDLTPNTTYTCTLTFLYENEEYTCEVEATTTGVVGGDEITTQEITTSSATFQITINEDPYSKPDRYGLAYITESNTTIFYADGEGIVTVEGLSEGTEYTLVIFLQYGDTRILTDESITFETKVTVPPTVQTLNAEDITFSSATLKGTVVQGDDEIESKGFEYWVTEDKKEIIPITGDEMSITIEDLTPTTTYTYCVYATTEKGTYVGDTITFTTLYDVESAYNELSKEIEEVTDELSNAWSEITTNYSDVVEDVQEDYDAISAELSGIQQKVKEAYENSTIDDDFVEEIKEELSKISPKIEELLSSAESAETDYLHGKIKDEINDALDTLDSAWKTITDDCADIVDEVQEDYDAIFDELSKFTQEVEDAYHSGELNKELVEIIESRLKEIDQEIKDLLTKAEEAEIEFLYSKIKDEISEALETLDSAWTTITTVDEDVAEEFEEDYNAISAELRELTQKVEEAYNNGEFNKELVETIESSLEEIGQEIKDLLDTAEEAETNYLYGKMTDGINDALDTLESAWTTITTEYADVVEEFEDDYKAIVSELDELTQKVEDANTNGEITKELVESIESSLEDIKTEIEELLTSAKEAETSYLYDNLTKEITDASNTLESAWKTITTVDADVAEEFEEGYKAIVSELDELSKKLESAHTAGELDKEFAESLESELAEISQEIDDLLDVANKAETEYLYNEVSDDVTSSQEALTDAWTTITTDYAEVAEEFEKEYNDLVIKLTSLRQELEDAYEAEELDKELVETLESSIAEINQEIEDLLISVMKAEATYLYDKVSEEVTGSEGTLDDAWTTITTDYADVADEFEEEYNKLVIRLTSLRQELDAAYEAEKLDKELVEELESSIEEINQEIEELLEKAKETDIEYFYNKVSNEIKETQDALEEAWTTITTDCADVAEEFEDDYKVIDTKLTSLSQEMADINNEGLTKELIESIESRVEEIKQEIEELLSSAKDAETSYLYNNVSDEIKETQDALEKAWETITTDYADIADELEDDYKAIAEELSDLAESLEDAYTNGELDKELVETIESSLEGISQEIEDLLSTAEGANTDYLYNKVTNEVKETQSALEEAWDTITTDCDDVAEGFEEDYKAIVDELSSLAESLEEAYTNGEFDKEVAESIESSLEEITQEIEALLSSAKDAETSYLYNNVSDEIKKAQSALEEAWETITTDYADIADELEDDYNAIADELSSLAESLEDAYTSGELDKELVETIESSLEEIAQEIETLLSSAKDAETSYLYNKVSDEIKEAQSALENTWTTITTDYPDVADELEDDYNAIADELSSLAESLEDAYTSGELDKELVETIESSLEEISQEIEDLLTTAKRTDIISFYNMVLDEIKDAQEALENTWSTITTDCSDVKDEFEADYKVIDSKLTSLSQEMVDIYNRGITRELIESIESRVEEINQEIEDLLTLATDAETSYLYDKVSSEIKDTEGALDDAWTTITTDYADVADEFEDDYKAIVDELSDVAEEFEEAYKAGDLDKELAESIEDSLEKINQEIEDLLAAAKQEHTSGISSIFIDFGDDVQIYNLNGSRVQNAERGKIYIIRYSDGTTRKVFAK